jgi:hypothetical protein
MSRVTPEDPAPILTEPATVDPPAAAAPINAHDPRDPRKWIGINRAEFGEYEYIEQATEQGRPIVIELDGQRFAHVAVDADGCWLYRRLLV